MKIFVTANPAAGRGQGERLQPHVVDYLRQRGCEVQQSASENASHLTALAQEAASNRFDAFVVCGGDGSAHHALNSLVHSTTALGIIPAGSANDLATALRIPTHWRQACELIVRAKPRRIDTVCVGQGWRHYASVGGVGFDSDVNRRANDEVKWLRGRAKYLYSIFRTLPAFKPQPLRLIHDTGVFEGRMFLAAVGNTFCYGGGVRIVPDAKNDDGLLDVCIVQAVSKWNIMRVLPQSYLGRHVGYPFIQMLRTRRVELSSDEPLELFGDGERICQTPVRLEAAPRSLCILAP